MSSIFADPVEHAPLIVETATRSDVGLRMANGEWIDLDRLPLSLEAVDGETVARLSGTAVAAMTTGRVMRAAQTFFEVPSRLITMKCTNLLDEGSKTIHVCIDSA